VLSQLAFLDLGFCGTLTEHGLDMTIQKGTARAPAG